MTIIKNYLFLFLFLFFSFCLFQNGLSQVESTRKTVEKDSAWKASQDYLNGVYIPVDEKEAVQEIISLSEGSGIETFARAHEDSIRGKLHYGLGGWMLQNWRLYSGSRLSYYLDRKGLSFADDKVEYLIIILHRHLNNKDLNSEALIAEFQETRKEQAEKAKNKRKENATIIKRYKLDSSQNSSEN